MSITQVILFGVYDDTPRARLLADGLRRHGVKVKEIVFPVWTGMGNKFYAKRWHIGCRLICACMVLPVLLLRYVFAPAHQAVIIPYPSFFAALLLWPFSRFRGATLVCDGFLPLYEMLVEDRKLLPAQGAAARMLCALEGAAFRRADHVLADTHAHAEYLSLLYRIDISRTGVVWVGCEADHFPPCPPATDDGKLRVLFYGQFIPLHGVDVIIEAAKLLAADEAIEFVLIGNGQSAAAVREQIEQAGLSRIRWIPWVEYEALHTWIHQSDVGLGIFGSSAKAARVIPNKLFQQLNAGRPVITMDSPAIRELPPSQWIVTIPPSSPEALAEAISVIHRQRSVHRHLFSDRPPVWNATEVGAQLLAVLQRDVMIQRKHTQTPHTIG